MAFLMDVLLSSMIFSLTAALPTLQGAVVDGLSPATILSEGCNLDFSSLGNAQIAWDNIGLSTTLDAFLASAGSLSKYKAPALMITRLTDMLQQIGPINSKKPSLERQQFFVAMTSPIQHRADPSSIVFRPKHKLSFSEKPSTMPSRL